MRSKAILTFFLTMNIICQIDIILGQNQRNPVASKNKTTSFKSSFIKSSRYCASMHGVSMVQALALFSEREVNDHEGKCFFHCMLQRFKLMDKDGNYIQDRFQPFMDYIPVSNFLKSIKNNLQTCLEEDDSDPCEKAHKFVKCFCSKGASKQDPFQDVEPADDL